MARGGRGRSVAGRVLAGFALGLVLVTAAAAETVSTLEIDGVISPATVRLVSTAIERARADGAAALVILLDTPGGLERSMRSIVRDMLNSPVPVIVYVAPTGARAASAGAFITIAAHVAAMAPATNIGAAHPVAAGGGSMDKEMSKKVENDAAAFIRSVARERGRNQDWAEKAVRSSVSATEQEALKLGIIDMVAESLPDLLAKVDGRQVKTSRGAVTLRTRGATVQAIAIGWRDRFLALISDPNIAYILLMLGMLGLFFELANPGVILPGVIGGISLILAFFAFQSLPINWAGLLLILFGIVLLIAEIKVVSHGVLTIGGIISILLGSMMLVNTPELPLRISWTVIIPVVALTAGIFVFAVSAGVRAQMERPTTGSAGLLHADRGGEDAARPRGAGARARGAVDGGGGHPGHSRRGARPRRRRRGAQASGGARVRPAGLTLPGGRMETAFYVVPVLIFGLIILSSSVKILREYERAVVFRLGRLVPNKGQRPGVILLIPFVDKMVKVSLRTVAMDVAPQDVISRDNVSLKVNAVIFFRVIDPRQAVVQVEDYLYATSQIAQTTLRSVLGQVELDDLLASRDQVNQQLQRIIDQHTDPWGVKVTAVEVKHVDLPQDMQRAMSKQAEAERERRAKVINAEGEFQAAEKLAQAAMVLAQTPIAVQLRFLQTMREVASERSTTTFFPIPIDLFSPFLKSLEGAGAPKP